MILSKIEIEILAKHAILHIYDTTGSKGLNIFKFMQYEQKYIIKTLLNIREMIVRLWAK